MKEHGLPPNITLQTLFVVSGPATYSISHKIKLLLRINTRTNKTKSLKYLLTNRLSSQYLVGERFVYLGWICRRTTLRFGQSYRFSRGNKDRVSETTTQGNKTKCDNPLAHSANKIVEYWALNWPWHSRYYLLPRAKQSSRIIEK